MGIADFLTVPFLLNLGITFVLVGILGVFLSQRIMEQNHKINSMMGLVSTMVEEMNYMRSSFYSLQSRGGQTDTGTGTGITEPTTTTEIQQHQHVESLISVSDDEDSDDDESNDESDDDESDDESLVEEEIVLNETEFLEESNIKVIDMGETMNIHYGEEEQDQEQEQDQESLGQESLDQESLGEDDSTIETIPSIMETPLDTLEVIKSIPIETYVSKPDIKKMTIQALRETAIAKGFTGANISKLKKAELVKIVEDLL